MGLPDRDYYLLGDAKFKTARSQYLAHIEKMLTMAGAERAWQSAQDILVLETELAQIQRSKVENRDPLKTYNRIETADLSKLAPGYAWDSYLREAGVADKVTYLIVRQPAFITGFNTLLQRVPLSVWKEYFRWRLLSDSASLLSKRFVDEDFAFNRTALRGIPEKQAPVGNGAGAGGRIAGGRPGQDLCGPLFPPKAKERMDQLVGNLIAAYRADISTLDWDGSGHQIEGPGEAGQTDGQDRLPARLARLQRPDH